MRLNNKEYFDVLGPDGSVIYDLEGGIDRGQPGCKKVWSFHYYWNLWS